VITLVTIGNGNTNFAMKFKEDYPYIGELYTDTKLKSYQAFQLERGIWETFGPNKDTFGMISTVLTGKASMGKVEGDALQQGGTFLIGPGNQVQFAYTNQNTGDHPDIESILKVVKKN